MDLTPAEQLPIDADDETVIQQIHELIKRCGGNPSDFSGELLTQLIQNNLKMIKDKLDLSQLKLITRSMKEIRYAYRIFNQYKGKRCVSIFGSARTPEHHLDYLAAKNFGAQMASQGWMCITGGANGIMKAGLEGQSKESCFGLSIRLPFEVPSSSLLFGDAKLISFRYFFTRKLMFLSHSDALAAFPGGFGTLDELFEVLTLQQTGRSIIVPVVLIEGLNGNYWKHWQEYIQKQLLKNGWISQEDQHLYYIAKNPIDAVAHIQKFYQNYHSSRYVKDVLVIRLNKNLTPEQLDIINVRYKSIVATGIISMVPPFPEETDHLELARLAFHHTHRDFGLIRSLINDLNEF